MTKLRLPVATLGFALIVAACASGGGSGGGRYGDAPAASSAAATTAPVTPIAVAPSSAGSSTSGYVDKSGYGAGSASAGSSAAPASAPAGTVRLSGFAFAPSSLSAAAGSTLTFVNEDGVPHDIVEGTGGAPAGSARVRVKLAPGASGSIVLPSAGALALTCTIHPSMNMTITVTP